MTHLLFHKTPNSVSSEPGAAHNVPTGFVFLADFMQSLLNRDLLMAIEAPPAPT
jgi:hypothetical protein